MTSYNPDHSHVSESAMTAFLHLKDLTDLTCIPGIGPVSKEAIISSNKNKAMECETGYALLGRFLALKKQNMSVVDHANAFFHWLEGCGLQHGHVNIHRIVHCVAEKANLMMDGLYSTSAWPEFHAKKVAKVGSQSSQRSQEPVHKA
jgi:hypothetical protein